ncbi:MAG: hypothetical protein HOM84_05295 [Thiotrichales bacterium]|jgi:hypothetical protein|nr:hypothetical protein [Thiotrichales bacterium]MBT3613819.1 hypothetical protein [Thiotrichales bacterium]MBT3751976.1 hypothetical protein [Thiotrichales bacterium]MBT3837060.1 hypothetical protein [Thiotrichales bacterium]MBT4153016.1 hypothetical protein [Thiotrichales bacterium]
MARDSNVENMADYEERISQAHAVMSLFQEWDIGKPQQMKLLGIEGEERELTKFRNGSPLPDNREVLERVDSLIKIGNALHINFPRTLAGGAIWLRNTNKYLPKRPPLTIMLEDGIVGIRQVLVRLDCTQGWD